MFTGVAKGTELMSSLSCYKGASPSLGFNLFIRRAWRDAATDVFAETNGMSSLRQMLRLY